MEYTSLTITVIIFNNTDTIVAVNKLDTLVQFEELLLGSFRYNLSDCGARSPSSTTGFSPGR
jgi:hypothetical protein